MTRKWSIRADQRLSRAGCNKLRYAATGRQRGRGLHSTTLRTVNMPRRDNPPLQKLAATDPPTGFGVNGTRRALAWNA